MSHMMDRSYEELAPNSTKGGKGDYIGGSDYKKVMHNEMPNNRMNDYVANSYAGPGSHKGKVKVKGHTEHGKQEDEYGDDYGV